MTWPRVLVSRLIGLFRKSRLDLELDEELRSHLEMLVEENLRKGMACKGGAGRRPDAALAVWSKQKKSTVSDGGCP